MARCLRLEQAGKTGCDYSAVRSQPYFVARCSRDVFRPSRFGRGLWRGLPVPWPFVHGNCLRRPRPGLRARLPFKMVLHRVENCPQGSKVSLLNILTCCFYNALQNLKV